MVEAIRRAQIAARKALECTYEGLLTVTEHRKEKGAETKLTGYKDIVVMENQPCKLSYESIQSVQQGESALAVTQTAKLIISPEVVIKAGSKITITQSGVTTDYTSSGVPAVYPTHQEIMLELFERWA